MPKKILIIDNDLVHVKTLENELINLDYSVITNTSGIKFLEQIEQEQPDIVLLDFFFSNLPSLDIVNTLTDKFCPFIFISTLENQKITKQMCTSGSLGFLIKPINTNQLIVEIEIALHWHTEKTQLNRRKDNINTTIENNRTISLAIGIIMERYQRTSTEAFETLRSVARHKQVRILDISKKLIKLHDHELTALARKNGLHSIHNKQRDLSSESIFNSIVKSVSG